MKQFLLFSAIFLTFLSEEGYGQILEPRDLTVPYTGRYNPSYWVDFNGDGAYDFIEVDSYAGSYIHLSKNGFFETMFVPAANFEMPDARMATIDHDGDGDTDILGRVNQSLAILEYDEESGFNIFVTGISYSQGESGDLFWVDIDGDLDPDIIHGQKIFLKSEGGYVQSRFSLPSTMVRIVPGDINNDGLVDIVAGIEYNFYDGSDVHVFINQGEGRFLDAGVALPAHNLIPNSIALLDTDRDGDWDIFASDRDNRGWIFKNNLDQSGALSFTQKQIYSNLTASETLVTDMNADGMQDLIIHSSAAFSMLINKTDGEIISFEATSHDMEVDEYLSLDLVDIDLDNDIDIHVKGYSSQIENRAFVNAGTPAGSSPPTPTNLSSATNEGISLSWDRVPGVLYNVVVHRNDMPYKTSSTSASGDLFVLSKNTLMVNTVLPLRGLPEGDYTWRVQAVDPSGRSSAFSAAKSFAVGAGPVLNLQPIDFSSVKLCWSYNGANTASFRIFRGTGTDVATEIAHVPIGTECFDDTTIPPNEVVTYFIIAVNGDVHSSSSNAVSHNSTQFIELPFGQANPRIIAGRCLSADYDMDGVYDLGFIGRIENENNGMLKNNGDGTFTRASFLPSDHWFPLTDAEMDGPRDMDNDGDPDLVLIAGESYSWRKIMVFTNNHGTLSKTFETPEYRNILQLSVEDMNNDGKPDLFFSHDASIYSDAKEYKLLYQNDAGGFDDSRIVFGDSESRTYAYFKLADLNNDGFTDILWSYGENRNMEILANEGGTAFTRLTSTLPLHYNMGVHDYNGDGKTDVVVLGNEGLNMYFGRGDFTFPEPKVIPIGYLSSSPTFVTADIDFNGWPDILMTDGYNSQVVFNKGNGAFKSSGISLQKGRGASITITDFEKDGDIDIVKLGTDYQQQNGLNYFYKNRFADLNVTNQPPSAPGNLTGQFEFGKMTLTWSQATDDMTPRDLLTYNLLIKGVDGKVRMHPETNEAGTFRSRLGPGNAGQTTSRIINNLPAGSYRAQVQSVDASFALSAWAPEFQFTIIEGPTDLALERLLLNKVQLTWTPSMFQENRIIIERRTIQSTWEVIAELEPGITTYVDANLEYNSVFQYRVFEASDVETTASSNIAEWSTNMWVLEETDRPNIRGAVGVADFTGDGRMDMLLSGGMIVSGDIKDFTRSIYENNSGTWTKTDITPSELPYSATAQVADLNGDYKPDIFLSGHIWNVGDKFETFQNNGDKTFTPVTNIFAEGKYSIESYFDFDMDNDLDIYALRSDSYSGSRTIFRNQGDGIYSQHQVTSCINCPSNTAVADFDGDGDEDVLVRQQSEYHIYMNTPNGLTASVASFPGYDRRALVSDYNGDGLPDVILLSSSSYYNSKIYKNRGYENGSLHFEEVAVELTPGEPSLVSADFDHDGLTDLVISSPGVTILLNKGSDSFQTLNVPSLRGSPMISIIDWDDDGDLDIYISNYYSINPLEGGKARILLNQTIVNGNGVSNTRPSAPEGLTATQDSSGVHLTWSKPHDDHTPAKALTYDVVLIRDGKTLSKGAHNPDNGKAIRLLPGKSTGIATFNNLLVGVYTWRVQAVDGSFARSDFAEGTFTFLPPPPNVRDTTIYRCGRTITLTAPGTDVEWYSDKNLTQLLASGQFRPTESQTVYVTQTVDGYRGIPRPVKITIFDGPPVPDYSIPNPLTICNDLGATLWASGSDLRWYSDQTLQNVVGRGEYIQVPALDESYYVTQTVDGCEGTPLEVKVKKINFKLTFYYSDGMLRVTETDADHYVWYRNGFFFQSTTDPFIAIPEEPATYSVSVSKEGCSAYSQPVAYPDEVTEAETQLEPDWIIFPNPASSHVTLKMMKAPGATVSIINTQGKLVYSNAFDTAREQTIDVSDWVAGIYMIIVDDGKSLSTKRLVLF